MKIRALCVMKNEADIIEQTLVDAARWCDEIFVLDNGSDDDGWERALALSRVLPAIVPHARDARPFTDDIRAVLFDAYSSRAEQGDWWCRLDADEFYVDDPREVLAAVAPAEFSVWSASLSFYFTDADVAAYAIDPLAYADSVPVHERLRYYLNHWSEPRFFRHERGLRWREGDGGYPPALWDRPASEGRILLRHFPYRSPDQIQRRLDARRASAEFSHEMVGNWAQAIAGIRTAGSFVGVPGDRVSSHWSDRVVASSALDYDAHDGRFVVNPGLMPAIPAPRSRSDRWRTAARGMARRLVGSTRAGAR